MGYCEYCERELPERTGAGRPRRYCGPACRKRAQRMREGMLPQDMMMADRWVRWRKVRRGGRVTKMPVQIDGAPASSTDPATWTGYPVVADSDVGAGMGFALGDGFACIDLDHCYDSRGHLADWAKFLLRLCPDTYVEISPSGDGLHIWGKCAPRPGIVVRDGMNVEAYSTGRYITVTGCTYKTSVPKLADLTLPMDWIGTLGR